jgi:hypothetical protein
MLYSLALLAANFGAGWTQLLAHLSKEVQEYRINAFGSTAVIALKFS